MFLNLFLICMLAIIEKSKEIIHVRDIISLEKYLEYLDDHLVVLYTKEDNCIYCNQQKEMFINFAEN
jgi:hypothetical protein